MTSLATCIKRAGKALSRKDADAIREIMAEGGTAQEAVDEYLNEMQAERAALMDEIEIAAGGQDAFRSDTILYSKSNIVDLAGRPIETKDIDFDKELTGALKEQERAFADHVIITPWSEMLSEYEGLTGENGPENTENGRIISVDAWRELDVTYRGDRATSPAVHEPSSTLSKKQLAEFLATPAGADFVDWLVWTSGGTGAGKTSGLELSEYNEEAGRIFDGNLSKVPSVLGKWAQVVQSGRFNVANHVIRDPQEAWVDGAIIRAIGQEIKWGTGRNVPIDAHFGTHIGSADGIRELHTIMYEQAPANDGEIVRVGMKPADMRQIKRDFGLQDAPPGQTIFEITDNRNGKGGANPGVPMSQVLTFGPNAFNELMENGRVILDHIYENGHPRKNYDRNGERVGGYKLSSKAYYGFIKENVPVGAPRFHQNFHEGGKFYDQRSQNGAQGPEQDIATELPRAEQEAFLYSRGAGQGAESEGDGERQGTERAGQGQQLTEPSGLKQAEIQLSLAPAIRALVGTVQVHVAQSTTELPGDAVPTDVEGLYRGGDEVWLVADNLPTAARAKQVLAHEGFGHLAMERMPEFQDVLASVRNMLAINNKTFTDVAATVAVTQGNLDETTQAKEILAYMAENNIENGVVAQAVAAVRSALRRMGLLDGATYTEAEIKALLVRAARDLVSDAAAKQKALAAMPVQQQILEDPGAVEQTIMLAIEEIYANAALQELTMKAYSEITDLEGNMDPAAQERLKDLKAAMYRAETAPGAAPDVMDPEAMYSRAFHGTAATFDSFDLKYMGSGEGAQAFGWGLYFTSERGVAEWYKSALAGPEYTFRGARFNQRSTKKLVQQYITRATKKAAPKNQKASPGSSDPLIASGTIASGVVGMMGRHDGSIANVLHEIQQQIDNFADAEQKYNEVADDDERISKVADSQLTKDKLEASRTNWRGLAERSAMTVAGWESAYKIVSDGLISYEGKAGNLMEVEIPDNDTLLHYEDTINEHSPEIVSKIKAHFPELFEVQWTDTVTGEPIPDEYIDTLRNGGSANISMKASGRGWQRVGEAIAKTEEDLTALGFVKDMPAESMTGDQFYRFVGSKMMDQKLPGIVGAFTNMFTGTTAAIGAQARDRIASEFIRDTVGIPGHSFIGGTSSKLNYVVYDDAQIQMQKINDVAVQVAEEVEEALYSRSGVAAETVDNPAVPGKPFIVYRLAADNRTSLKNTNAGNAMGVAAHLMRVDDMEGPAPAYGFGDTVHVYEVTVDEFGDYQQYHSGESVSRGAVDGVVGRSGTESITYSFPESGFKSKRVAKMPFSELKEKIVEKYKDEERPADAEWWQPSSTFDDIGSRAGGEIIAGASANLFSRAKTNQQKEFLDKFYERTQVHPLDGQQRISRDATAMLQLQPLGDDIHLSAIQTLYPGERRGGASRMLDEVIEIANDTGVRLTGTAKAFGTAEGRLTTAQLKSWYKRKGFKVIGDQVIYEPPGVESLFSRAGQYLQIDDKQKNQPPQLAAKEATPKDLDTAMYWVLASEAGTRAFSEPKGSWEERYYTAMGRNASQAAKTAKQMAPIGTEQMALFSRADRRRSVLRTDEHGKDIVWEQGPYSISVNNVQDASFIALWHIDERTPVGTLNLRAGRDQETMDYAAVDYVEIDKKHRDQRLGTQLYRIALRYAGDQYRGLASEYVDRRNKNQVPSIYKALGGAESADTGNITVETPLYSRKIHSNPAVEQLRDRVLSPALEDLTIKDRVRGIVDRIKAIEWLGIKQGIIDSAASVADLERGIFDGELLDASRSAYKAILSTRNLGSVMAAIMHRGIPIYQNGVFTARTGRKGLIDIFQKITHHKDGNLLPLWELYAVANRSQRLIQEKNRDGTSKEKVLTQQDINLAMTLEIEYPEFKVALAEWQVFNSQLLDLAIKRGVINGHEAKVWRQNDYVPFYRAMEEIEYEGGQGQQVYGEGVGNVRSGIKRLTGSEAKIGNVFENMVQNTAYLTDAIFRNTAMQRVVLMADGIAMRKVPMAFEAVRFNDTDLARALMKAGLIVGNGINEADMFNDGIRQVGAMTRAQKEHWSVLFRKVAPQGPNIISVLEQGKPVYYEVEDPLLLRALGAMGAAQWKGVMHTFRFAKRTLTKMVTIDPAFMMANFLRDTLSTGLYDG